MTLFCKKYSSQVALRLEPLQKRRQSAVVTVPLLTTCVLAQVSKLRFASVRFPSRQTLEQGEDRARFQHSSQPIQWEAQPLPCYCRGRVSGASIKSDSNSIGTDLTYKPSTDQGCPPAWGNSGRKVVISSTKMANPQLLGFHCILAAVFPTKDHGFGQSTPKQPPHPWLGSHSFACLLLPWSPWSTSSIPQEDKSQPHRRGFYEARSHGVRMGHTGKPLWGSE